MSKMSQYQFTNNVTQSHYFGNSLAQEKEYICADGSKDHVCIRNFATISSDDIKKYDIMRYPTLCGEVDWNKCPYQDNGVTYYPDQTIQYDSVTCGPFDPQVTCSVPNALDCESYTDSTTGATNAPSEVDQTSMLPGGSRSATDKNITCRYTMNTGDTSDFKHTGIARAYLDKHGYDDTWNNVIMPYFCGFSADVLPDTHGYDLPPNTDGTQKSGAQPIASRFVGLGSQGDADFCRNWVNTNSENTTVKGLAMNVMSTWCNSYPWLPECKCMERADPVYGDPNFVELYDSGMGIFQVGCWWEPCSMTAWNERDMLVEPDNVFAQTTGQCDDACVEIINVINSTDVDLSDITQSMECTIDDSDVDQPSDDDDNGIPPSCVDDANPKQCTCDATSFTTGQSFIQDSINDMPSMNSTNNQSLVAMKANQYAKDTCYSGQTYEPNAFSAWMSTPPFLDKIPIFDANTGAFYNTFEEGIPTADEKQTAVTIWNKMQSTTQFPCQSKYPVWLDVAGTVQGLVTNEHYQDCATNESNKFSVPDSKTNACPYVFDATDVYGVPQTYDVNPTYRDNCVHARGGIEYLPADGEDPNIDDIDTQYGLTVPLADGSCPSVRTYTDEFGEQHTKEMSADEIAVCKSSPDYIAGNDDDDNDDDDSGWFSQQSTGVKVAIVTATSLIGGFLVLAGGMVSYKMYKQYKTAK